jgi:hypothetical protein
MEESLAEIGREVAGVSAAGRRKPVASAGQEDGDEAYKDTQAGASSNGSRWSD